MWLESPKLALGSPADTARADRARVGRFEPVEARREPLVEEDFLSARVIGIQNLLRLGQVLAHPVDEELFGRLARPLFARVLEASLVQWRQVF